MASITRFSLDKISNFVESQIPSFIKDSGQNFVDFVKAYYQFNEEKLVNVTITSNTSIQSIESGESISAINGLLCGDGITLLGGGSNTNPIIEIDSYTRDYEIIVPKKFTGMVIGTNDLNSEDDVLLKSVIMEHKTGTVNNFDFTEETTVVSDSILANSNYYSLTLSDVSGTYTVGGTIVVYDGQLNVGITATVVSYDATTKTLKVSAPSAGFFHVGNEVKSASNLSITGTITAISSEQLPTLYSTQELETPIYAMANIFNFGDVDYAFNSQLFKDSDYYVHLSEEILKDWHKEFYLTIEDRIKGVVAANISDVYQSKGTPSSINATTKILWGSNVEVDSPSEKVYALNSGVWGKSNLKLITSIDAIGHILGAEGRVLYKKSDAINYGYANNITEQFTSEYDPNYAFVGSITDLSIYEVGGVLNDTYDTSACKIDDERVAICWSGSTGANFDVATVKDSTITVREAARYSLDMEGTYNTMCYDSVDNIVVIAFDNKIVVGQESNNIFTFSTYTDALPNDNCYAKKIIFIPDTGKFVLLYSNHATLRTYVQAGSYADGAFTWGSSVELLKAIATNPTYYYSLEYVPTQDVVVCIYHGAEGSDYKLLTTNITVESDNSVSLTDRVILESLSSCPCGVSATYDSFNDRIVYMVGYGENLITNFISASDSNISSATTLTYVSTYGFYGLGCAYDSTVNRIIYTWGVLDGSGNYSTHYTKVGNINNDILTVATNATSLNISYGSGEDLLVPDMISGKAVYIAKKTLGGGSCVIIKADRTGKVIVELSSMIGNIFPGDSITGTTSTDETFECYVYDTIDSSQYYTDNNLLNGGKARDLPNSYAVWDDAIALTVADYSVTSRIQDSYYYQSYSYDIKGDNFYTEDMFQAIGIATGYNHNIIVKADGNILIWGENDYGQLGIGTNIAHTTPVELTPGDNYKWIKASAGKWTSYAIKTAGDNSHGSLWSWGNNWYGQLGYDTKEYVYGPIAVNCSSLMQVGSMTDWATPTRSHNKGYTAIKDDNTLWCWGYNEYGQVGKNTTFNYSSPVQISAGGGYWKQSVGGAMHTAAIKSDGTLWTWGRNNFGQLGNGATSDIYAPTSIDGNDWSSVTVGYTHTVAIKTDGSLWAWGSNAYGQLGNGTTDGSSEPIQIGNDHDWAQVDSQYYHTLAIKADGTLWAWGKNTWGALGKSTQINYSSPVQIGQEAYWSQIAAGVDHSLAMSDSGVIFAWGLNKYGQLGLGEIDEIKEDNLYLVTVPTLVANTAVSSTATTAIGHNSKFYATVKTDGTLWAWGNNVYGQLGDGTTLSKSSPVQVGTANNWIQVAQGQFHTVAIDTDGKIWSWGRNNYGQLGDGTFNNSSTPNQIGSSTIWSKVVCGLNSTMAIKTNGTLWGWGRNERGELGNGTTTNVLAPTQIGSSTIWSQVAISSGHTVAVKTNGTLWSWGSNTHGQLGDGTRLPSSTPSQIGSLNDWTQVAVGTHHTVAVKSDGTLWGWGYNQYSQLGNGTTTKYSSPVQIGTGTSWAQVATNYYHTTAIKSDNSLWAWGWNNYGQLGIGSQSSQSIPVHVGTANNWVQVENSSTSTYATNTDGELYSWGQNDFGQLGYVDSYTYNKNVSSPIQVGAPNEWKQIAAANLYSAAVKLDGTLWTWGYNRYGQLGHSDVVDRSTPTQVGSMTSWNKVTCLQNSLLVTNNYGELYGVGYNETGNLGITNGLGYYKNVTNRISPTQIGSDFNWKSVAANTSGTFAIGLKTDGTLWAWGQNDLGQLAQGNSIDCSSPVQIGTDKVWSKISAGVDYAAAFTDDNTLWVWGSNSYGKLGNGNNTGIYYSPVQVGLAREWKDISCGIDSTIGIKANSTLWAWGRNNYGQLGIGTTVDKSFPVLVSTSNWNSVSSGENYSFAINTNNTLYGWGKGSYQLGVATDTYVPTIIGSQSWDTVVAGRETSMGISSYVPYTWGENYLGSENITVSYDPVRIISIPFDAIFVDDYRATIQNLVHPAGMKMFINGE